MMIMTMTMDDDDDDDDDDDADASCCALLFILNAYMCVNTKTLYVL